MRYPNELFRRPRWLPTIARVTPDGTWLLMDATTPPAATRIERYRTLEAILNDWPVEAWNPRRDALGHYVELRPVHITPDAA